MYSYDAVGCFEKMKYTVSGSGQALIEPFLDNMVAYKNTDKKPANERSSNVAAPAQTFVLYLVAFSWDGCGYAASWFSCALRLHGT